MANPLMTKNFVAGGAIAASTIVKFGADDDTVVIATAAGDSLIGVAETITAASGERVDVIVSGIADVKAGGSITRGALVTANASGQAVAAASTNRAIGIALASAASGDVFPVLLAPSVM